MAPVAYTPAAMTTNHVAPTAVFELPADRPTAAEPLYREAWADRAYLDSVFEGISPARVFVDDPEQPQSALMCRTYEFYLGGEPTPSMERFLAEAPAEADVFGEFYGYVAFNDRWIAALDAAYGGRPNRIGRRSFTFPADGRALVSGWQDRVLAGIEVRELDLAGAQQADDELDEVIALMWGGYEHFLSHGFGFAAFDGPRMVSVTFTIGRSSREMNIGVVTDAAYRRRGLATLTSQATIERAIDLGLTSTWDCDTLNERSAALALKLGFVEGPPFIELELPQRAKPDQSTGLWTRERLDNGVVRWRCGDR